MAAGRSVQELSKSSERRSLRLHNHQSLRGIDRIDLTTCSCAYLGAQGTDSSRRTAYPSREDGARCAFSVSSSSEACWDGDERG